MRLARTVAGIGRIMITAGVLILLFVAYQLWGTGIHTARAQDRLAGDFDAAAEAWAEENPEPVSNGEGRRPRQVVPAVPERGGVVGRIQIPRIGVDWYFLEGVGLDVLSEGPGHYEGTPLPGQRGNAAIAGHRTTYGQPFHNLDRLDEGDRIIIRYITGARFTYQYRDTQIVRPDQTEVLEPAGDNRLTLTACHPKYSAAERIVVTAELLDRAAPGPEPAAAPVVDDTESLDGQSHARAPAVLWGIAAASVWSAAWVVGRAWRRWPSYLVGLPLFLLVLYGFFENFSHLLPAAY